MRPRIFDISNLCTACGACASICPQKCITMSTDEDGFYHPMFNESGCISCSLCEKACHVVSKSFDKVVSTNNNYIYASSNDEIRKHSSSGGAFSMLAEYVISKGGIVFGSAYNANSQRLEQTDTNRCTLERIRKSKYIESYTGTIYTDVLRNLKEKRLVMYCGTPCQVRGLHQFLYTKNVDTNQLILVDFLCHGVPSNKCFQEYKRKFETRKRILDNVDFRYKDDNVKLHGWHNLVLKFSFNDGSTKLVPYAPPYWLGYMKPFEDGLILRESCYSCNLPLYSVADFTLGDFWGVCNYNSNIDDNRGISIVKVHSEKANKIWKDVSRNAIICESVSYDTIEYIYRKNDKGKLKEKRDAFYASMKNIGYKKSVYHLYKKRLIHDYTLGFFKTIVKYIIQK